MPGSAMDTLKGLLGDNADEKIKAAIGALSSGSESHSGVSDVSSEDAETEIIPVSNSQNNFDSGTMDSLMQIKNIVDNFANSGNDSRSNLLMSLKPYMRTSRQSSIDTAIRILNLSKLSGIFKLR
ncbi:MAG: hypothetical protein IJ300_05170 [Clostridia bacterium]|nr:hypothetical protein [Clostridia bacterium]